VVFIEDCRVANQPALEIVLNLVVVGFGVDPAVTGEDCAV
jgi:hypothetical protein